MIWPQKTSVFGNLLSHSAIHDDGVLESISKVVRILQHTYIVLEPAETTICQTASIKNFYFRANVVAKRFNSQATNWRQRVQHSRINHKKGKGRTRAKVRFMRQPQFLKEVTYDGLSPKTTNHHHYHLHRREKELFSDLGPSFFFTILVLLGIFLTQSYLFFN